MSQAKIVEWYERAEPRLLCGMNEPSQDCWAVWRSWAKIVVWYGWQ